MQTTMPKAATSRVLLALGAAALLALLAGTLIYLIEERASNSVGFNWAPGIDGIAAAGLVYLISSFLLLKQAGVHNTLAVLALGIVIGWVLSSVGARLAMIFVGNTGWGLLFSLAVLPAILSICGVALANRLIGSSSPTAK